MMINKFSIKLLTILFSLSLFINHAKAEDDLDIALANTLQIISLHVGGNIDFNAPIVNGAVNIGVSAGWNNFYFHRCCGVRAKYMYEKNTIQKHSVGLIGYYYPISNNEILNTFFSYGFGIAFGAGGIFAIKDDRQANGGYIETGVTLFKRIPLNIDILYRIGFYEKSPVFNNRKLPITHSLQFVVNIL